MESKTLGREWLKFTNNILLPFGAIMSVIRILVLIGNADSLPEGYVGGQVLSALVSLGLSASLFFGLKRFKSWAWYLMLVMLVLTPIGAAISRIPGNAGNQGVTVALLVIGLLAWTLPNVVYFYRRRSWFGITSDILVTTNTPLSAQTSSTVVPPTLSSQKQVLRPESLKTSTVSAVVPISPSTVEDDREIYARAVREFESEGRDAGLWGLAVSGAGGDMARAQSMYIDLRVRDLKMALLRTEFDQASIIMDVVRMDQIIGKIMAVCGELPQDMRHFKIRMDSAQAVRKTQNANQAVRQAIDANAPLEKVVPQIPSQITIAEHWDIDLRQLAEDVNAERLSLILSANMMMCSEISAEFDSIEECLLKNTGSCRPEKYDRYSKWLVSESPEAAAIHARYLGILKTIKESFMSAKQGGNYNRAEWLAAKWLEWQPCKEAKEAQSVAAASITGVKNLGRLPRLLSSNSFEAAIELLRQSESLFGADQIITTPEGSKTVSEYMADVKQIQQTRKRRKVVLFALLVGGLIFIGGSIVWMRGVMDERAMRKEYSDQVISLLFSNKCDEAVRQYEHISKTMKGGREKAAACRTLITMTVLLPAAEKGDAAAQTVLGWMYATGFGVESNDMQAAIWYRKAAEQGNMFGQYYLAGCFMGGRGVAQDVVASHKWYLKAAEQGDSFCQLMVGVNYAAGLGVDRDLRESAKWYRKAAESGSDIAQWMLSQCYSSGSGVIKDEEESYKWCRKAAVQGYATAQSCLGRYLLIGIGVEQNANAAFQWYKKAAEQGDADGQNGCAVCCENGLGTIKDLDQAVKWYRKAAEQKNVNSQIRMGRLYASGAGIEKNLNEAKNWFSKAAENGSLEGLWLLGICYESGLGVTQDFTEAVRLYSKAAEKGYASAQVSLGQCIESGNGVYLDKVAACKWYRKAAELGDAAGQINIGRCLETGSGVIKDELEAAKWYQLAAQQGDSDGEWRLGVCCQYGQGVVKDLAEAVKLYRKSAEKGNAEGQYRLGYCFAKGIGVPSDSESRNFWYIKAAEQGHVAAKEELRKIQKFADAVRVLLNGGN